MKGFIALVFIVLAIGLSFTPVRTFFFGAKPSSTDKVQNSMNEHERAFYAALKEHRVLRHPALGIFVEALQVNGPLGKSGQGPT